MALPIFNGEAGDEFVNSTNKVLYQLIVNWTNSCGLCCQNDHAVSYSWPIPFHRSCRCTQVAIYPGHTARPFVDFRQKISELDSHQQSRVVGRSNLQLIEAGVVRWEDVVTRGRIRDLNQVVAIKRLTLKELDSAGVSPAIARRAYDSVHTPLHALEARQRQDLVDRLKAKGVERDDLKRLLGERIAARISIGQGPSGAQPSGVVPSTPKLPPTPAKPPVTPPVPTPRPPAKPRRPAAAIPVPVAVRERADYLIQSQVKPEVARLAARKEQVAGRLEAIAGELEAAFPTSPAADRLQEERTRFTQWQTRVESNPKLIPPWSVPDRIAEYARSGGAEKLKAVLGLGEKIAPLQQAISSTLDQIEQNWRDASLFERLKDLREQLATVTQEAHKDFLAAVGAQAPMVIEQAPASPAMRVVPLRSQDQPAIDQALAWLRPLVESAGAGKQVIPVGTLADPVQDRAHANDRGIALAPGTNPRTMVHEFGHWLEDHAAVGAPRAFLAHRVKDETPRPMQQVAPEGTFTPDELGRKDRFDEVWPEVQAYYVGKVYGAGTEITAMGLEQLFVDPARFAKKDPEFVLFLLGLLDGSLR